MKERSLEFDSTKANVDIKLGSPLNQSNTVYLTTTDKEGNACSFIMSNYAGFGSGKIPKSYGFTLQNRGSNFSLDPTHPNKLEPNKRPFHTIIPAMCLKDNKLFLSYGVMGGYMQPQGHLQVLSNIVNFGMAPQKALDSQRFCIEPDQGIIYLENGVGDDVVEELKDMGHNIKVIKGFPRKVFGRGQVILKKVDKKTEKFVWVAGSDPRADGQAAGY